MAHSMSDDLPMGLPGSNISATTTDPNYNADTNMVNVDDVQIRKMTDVVIKPLSSKAK